jgi:hypothetical protein
MYASNEGAIKNEQFTESGNKTQHEDKQIKNTTQKTKG